MAGNPEHERGRISCYALGRYREWFELSSTVAFAALKVRARLGEEA